MLRTTLRRTPALLRPSSRAVGSHFSRSYSHSSGSQSHSFSRGATALALVSGSLLVGQLAREEPLSADATVDYDAVAKDIADLLDDEKYDDGSYGPVFVRLAWHASGTYCRHTKTGGSEGATMRFPKESSDGANAGLHIARNRLEPLIAKYPGLSHGDLWVLASYVAIEQMGGPKIRFHPGRKNAPTEAANPPVGRLPDAAQGHSHIHALFEERMGFTPQETVALVGAHCLGRCHKDRSGFDGPWTFSPTMFTNDYFVKLLEEEWREKKWKGPKQFEDAATGSLMMLPADVALLSNEEYRKWVETYAKDEARFFKDFSKAFQKLTELGCDNLQYGWFESIFG